MKCHACESTVIYINGLCKGCYDDLCSGGDDATTVAEKLVSVIAAKDARIAELEQCFDSERQRHRDTGARIPPLMARIAELAAALERTQQSREHRTNLLLTSMDKSGARIAELEIQLAAALVMIERAL